MNVSGLTMAIIVFNMLVGIGIPLILCIVFRKRYRCDMSPFWVGCGTMFLFALVLEQVVHAIVLSGPAGGVIKNQLWLYALYGALMAGLFEETGRFLAMKFVLKKRQGNDRNALMYGAGHGGFEAFYILFISMLNNLIYAVMLNSGSADMLLNSLDATNREALQQAFEALATTSPLLFLAAPVERLAAVTAQISLSVLVWFAVKERGQMGWYFLAIFLHALLDAVAVVLNGIGTHVAVTEAAVWVLALLYVLLASRVWKAKRSSEPQRV